ncbi:MAG TPA: WD40 repeat domain-containing protein, partial [Polyangiaceae bacterium]|nr:WD40 repeat domain-containing protein [Polyangiaceae bacterium]
SHVVDAKDLGLAGEQFHAVAYHPEGRRAAASTESGLLVSWEVASNARLGVVQAHPFGAELVFSRDGERLLSVATDGVMRTFEGASLTPLGVQPKAFDVDVVAARPGARAAAFASSGGVIVRDAESGALTHAIRPALPISAVAADASMSRLALGTEAGAVVLLDVATGALRWLRGHTAAVTGLAFSPDGGGLTSTSRDQMARVWDVTSGESRRSLAHPTALEAVAYRSDGRVLATAGDDGVVRVWEVASGERLRALPGNECAVLALAFSPDGAVLAANSADHSLRLWDGATFAPRVAARRAQRCGGELSAWRGTLGFDAAGSLIASAPSGHEVGLWNARTGQPQGALPDLSPAGREFHVRSVAVSPRGPLVVAAAGERLVTWRLSDHSGTALATAPVEVDAVTFSGDGRFLIGASHRGAVSLWRVGLATELELELWIELGSESSGSVRASDGRVEWLGSQKPPAACVLGHHVYPAELCEARFVVSGLLAEALAENPSSSAPR